MPTFKPKRLMFALPLALLGAGYFAAFSGLESPPILKEQLVLLPVQLGILVYLLWWRQEKS
ncbi:MAG: hypothetical protein HY785_22030 [Oscillatoriophycideae cyanobacterium NC_groundwater_1537_Pr4_S-0.65um_50_18]|nr:hypothetical protein [Oscillatoriophycideae cyanobacterium NC_groundwater_1537_Pr4_S-0.65um_50_18]